VRFSERLARGNPVVPEPPIDGPEDFALLKYAGAKSVAAFDRGARTWRLSDHGSQYRIIASKPGRVRGWQDDLDNIVIFPPGTELDEVIDRAIAILQAASAS